MLSYPVIPGAAPGTTCGNHRANYPRHLRASPGMVFAVQVNEPAWEAGRNPCRIPPYKRGGLVRTQLRPQVFAGQQAVEPCRLFAGGTSKSQVKNFRYLERPAGSPELSTGRHVRRRRATTSRGSFPEVNLESVGQALDTGQERGVTGSNQLHLTNSFTAQRPCGPGNILVLKLTSTGYTSDYEYRCHACAAVRGQGPPVRAGAAGPAPA